MITCKTYGELHGQIQAWKDAGLKVGFVPTMGALHEGHLSLMRLAKERADKVVVSVYVNPTQFAPHEDFDSYPRDVDSDVQLLDTVGVDLLYLPLEADMYPNGPQVTVQAGKAAEGLETEFRAHFFHGVATVVHRLFQLVTPDIAVFGEKDFQQLQVIKEMVAQYKLPIEIIGGPIARDEHGLALSSRNAYLNEGEMVTARMLNQVIYNVAHRVALIQQSSDTVQTEAQISALGDEAGKMLLSAGFDKVDYVAYRENWGRVLAAGWVGKTRLIDNVGIKKAD